MSDEVSQMIDAFDHELFVLLNNGRGGPSGFFVRVGRVLMSNQITTLSQFAEHRADDFKILRRAPNIGAKTLDHLRKQFESLDQSEIDRSSSRLLANEKLLARTVEFVTSIYPDLQEPARANTIAKIYDEMRWTLRTMERVE
jgi:hypothetical protein